LVVLIGIVTASLIALSYILMHYYFQIGRDFIESRFINALWITFGKVIFVLAVMIFLMSLSYTSKLFPSFIANCGWIQLIGN